jgi:hypothetical protein
LASRRFRQEKRPSVSEFDSVLLVSHGAGERPLYVAEQCRFEQLAGDGSAVDRHEWLVFPQALDVNRPGEQFFSGACLRAHEDGEVAASGAPGHLEHRDKRFGTPDDVLETVLAIEALPR